MKDEIQKQIRQAAVIAYGDEELVDEFMGNFHKGSISKAVLGDENGFVCPSDITPEQLPAMLDYLAGLKLDDNSRINKLRLDLDRAVALYSSPETHGLMARKLGEVWDMALQTWNDKTAATEFLLSKNGVFEGRRPFDIAVSGEAGHQMVYDHLGRIQHGVYM